MTFSPKQAEAVIVLWQSGLFDTLEIANVLGMDEPSVCRLLQAIRDIAHGEAAA